MLGSSSSALRLGRLSGVPVQLSPGALFIAAILALQLSRQFAADVSTTIAWITAVITALGFLASILAHELGHTVVAQKVGIEVKEIRLWFMGGAAALERSAPTANSEMAIAVAGPAVSLGVGLTALGASMSGIFAPVVASALGWIGAINLILAAFNMLPALPLDGGRALTGWLWRRRGDRLSAIQTTAKVGTALGRFGFALAALQFFSGSSGAIFTAFVSFIVLRGSAAEVASEELVARGGGRRVSDVMVPQPPSVNERSNVASARAMLPSPDPTQLHHNVGLIVDDDNVARGVVNLVRLAAAADKDGTQNVLDEARSLGQHDVAFRHEQLEDVLRRTSALPVVVIDDSWRPIGVVTATSLLMPPAAPSLIA